MIPLKSFLWRVHEFILSRVHMSNEHAALVALALEATYRDTEYMVNVYASAPSRLYEVDYYRNAVLALARAAEDYTGSTAATIARDENEHPTIVVDQMEDFFAARKADQADLLKLFRQGNTRDRSRPALAGGEETRTWIKRRRRISAPKFYIGTVLPPVDLGAFHVVLWQKRDESEPVEMPDPLQVERSAAPLHGTPAQILRQIAAEAAGGRDHLWPGMLEDALKRQRVNSDDGDAEIIFDMIEKYRGAPWRSTLALVEDVKSRRIGKNRANKYTLATMLERYGVESVRFGKGRARGWGYMLDDLQNVAEALTGHRSRPIPEDAPEAEEQEAALEDWAREQEYQERKRDERIQAEVERIQERDRAAMRAKEDARLPPPLTEEERARIEREAEQWRERVANVTVANGREAGSP